MASLVRHKQVEERGTTAGMDTSTKATHACHTREKDEKKHSVPLPPKARRPVGKDLPGSRIRLELYEMRKAQAQLAARQRLLQDKILEERKRATALATLENTRVKAKLDEAERSLNALKKQQSAPLTSKHAQAHAQNVSLVSPLVDSFDDDISVIELGHDEEQETLTVAKGENTEAKTEDLVEEKLVKENIDAEDTNGADQFLSWYINYSENGDRYFYCEETQESTWNDPRSLKAQEQKPIPPMSYWHDLWRGPYNEQQRVSAPPPTVHETPHIRGRAHDRLCANSARKSLDPYHSWQPQQSPEYWTPMSARELMLQESLANMQRVVAEAKQNELRALSRAEATALTQAKLVERVRLEERRQLALTSARVASRRAPRY